MTVHSLLISAAAQFVGAISPGIRARLAEHPELADHHHVVVVVDPRTGRAEIATSLSRRELRDVLRDAARGL
jgi:hypothetical protein